MMWRYDDVKMRRRYQDSEISRCDDIRLRRPYRDAEVTSGETIGVTAMSRCGGDVR